MGQGKPGLSTRTLGHLSAIGIVFLFLLLPLACFPLPQKPIIAQEEFVEVELDIFSGRPNPQWILNPQQTVELSRRLQNLSPTLTGEPSDHLGYRGLILYATDKKIAGFEQIVCSGGVVVGYGQGPPQKFSDPQRSLERWLIQTGQSHLDQEIQTLIHQDMK